MTREVIKVMLPEKAGRAIDELRRRVGTKTPEARLSLIEAMHSVAWLSSNWTQPIDASLTLGPRIGDRQHIVFMIAHAETMKRSYTRAAELFAKHGMDVDLFLPNPTRYHEPLDTGIHALKGLLAMLDAGQFVQPDFCGVALADADGRTPDAIAKDLRTQMGEF